MTPDERTLVSDWHRAALHGWTGLSAEDRRAVATILGTYVARATTVTDAPEHETSDGVRRAATD
jgi:hypothetical protein